MFHIAPLAVEFCLAHKLRDRVEAGDLRTDLLAKRRDTDEIYVKPTEISEFGGTYEVRNSSSTDIPRILHP